MYADVFPPDILFTVFKLITIGVNYSYFFLSLLPEILHRKMCKDND
jgi:hypothetical protein